MMDLKKTTPQHSSFKFIFLRVTGWVIPTIPRHATKCVKVFQLFKFTRRDENCIIKKACENLITL